MHIALHVNLPLLLLILIGFELFLNIKNTTFNENPSSGSRVPPCGWTNRYDDAKRHILQPYECV
jgi:hypothetical protein